MRSRLVRLQLAAVAVRGRSIAGVKMANMTNIASGTNRSVLTGTIQNLRITMVGTIKFASMNAEHPNHGHTIMAACGSAALWLVRRSWESLRLYVTSTFGTV